MSSNVVKYLLVYPTQEQVKMGIEITTFRDQLRRQDINGLVVELPGGAFIVTLTVRDEDEETVPIALEIIDVYCAAMNLTKSQVIVCQLNLRCCFLDIVNHLDEK